MKSKRVSAPKAGTIKENGQDKESLPEGKFVPTLSHITTGCSVREVSLSACIPLHLTRPHNDNAVRKLKANLVGENAENAGENQLSGMVSGSPTAVVVPLVGDLEPLLYEYLQKKFPVEEDRVTHKKRHATWYGVIDGCFLHTALSELEEEYPSQFKDFLWKVICVHHGLDISEYRKLAVVQNERNKQAYHYEFTVSDLLRSLRDIYDSMYQKALKESRGKKSSVTIPHKDVAHMYDGACHDKNTTVRQAVSVAIRLSKKTIESIAIIMDKVCPDIILNNRELNSKSLTSTDSILSQYDCRLFKRFLCTSTLRGATIFLNALKDGHGEAQVNAIYRVKHWCELNNYRAVPAKILNESFVIAKLAIAEESKFLSFIERSSWPDNMETTRENILRTTVFDRELNLNKGNTTDVLPAILTSYRRLYPSLAKSLGVAAKKADDEQTTGDSEAESNSDVSTTPPQAGASTKSTEEEEKKREEVEAKEKEKARRLELRTKGDKILRESGIETHPMPFNEFVGNVWSTDRSRVDLVLSNLPSNVDKETMEQLPTFCSTVLKTGCYVVLIVSQAQFTSLQGLFTSANFKVCSHPFSILYDTSNLKRRRSIDFPIVHSDIAFLAKTQGRHPGGFIPEFAMDSSDAACHSSNIFASISNVRKCSNMLKLPKQNSPVFADEKSTDLFAHIVRLFTPCGAIVIDPFGGPLTTSIACIKMDRKCISMDIQRKAMAYALGRLRICVTPDATMEQLDAFTEVIDLVEHTPETSNQNELTTFQPTVTDTTESTGKRRRLSRRSKDGDNEPASSEKSGDPNLSQPQNEELCTSSGLINTKSSDELDGAAALLGFHASHAS